MKFIILIFPILLSVACRQSPSSYFSVQGTAQGTTYKITYELSPQKNLKPQIDSLLARFDSSLSGYISQSILSKVNNNQLSTVDTLFAVCFDASRKMWEQSEGVFDITAAPFFNVWGFGYTEKQTVDKHVIDSIKSFVGMEKVSIDHLTITKQDPRLTLNFNAIAQGYSVDVVGKWLESLGVKNYMVEIGGEIYCKGNNSKGLPWKIGIDKPVDGNMSPGEELATIIELSDKGLATSGNYRKFYVVDDRKVSHTIDPRTGYPAMQNLLSATVIANTAMEADAAATSIMVMGLEKAKPFIEKYGYQVYLIYDNNGQYDVFTNINVIEVKP